MPEVAPTPTRCVPGLLPFHLGAFAAAVQAGVPVVPVAIRGSRALFRAGQWFARRGSITVTIGAPIASRGDTPDAFAAAVGLRDLARAEILRHCGEPEIGSAQAARALLV